MAARESAVKRVFQEAEAGNVPELERLLAEWQIDPNVNNEKQSTLLHAASENGQLEVRLVKMVVNIT